MKGNSGIHITMKSRFGFNFFDVFAVLFCIGFGFICFYPMWYVFIGSIMDYKDFVQVTFPFFPPLNPTFKYYEGILAGEVFQKSMLLSISKTLFTSVSTIILTAMMAYAVTKTRVKGMKTVNFLMIFTLLFSGGLIPSYLLIRNLHMYNTFWALTIPWLLSPTTFAYFRSYFATQGSADLEEAAKIDGANDVFIFFKIIFPISIPVFAALFLFEAVGSWNDWYSYLIYCEDVKLQPVVWLLRRMLIDPTLAKQSTDAGKVMALSGRLGYLPPAALKMTTIILSMLPIIIVYPLLQRYFVKGIMLGAVKG